MVSSWERALQRGEGQAAAVRQQTALRAQAQARSNWSNTVRLANEAKSDAAAAAEANRRMPVQDLFAGPQTTTPTPLDYFAGRQEQAARQAQNAPVWEMMLYGEQKESALPGQQEAGRFESFVRTQAGEDEFRLAGQRAREGRLGAAAGWGLLGLAGAVPVFGDIGKGIAATSRAAGTVADAAKGGAKLGVGSTEVLRTMQPDVANTIVQGPTVRRLLDDSPVSVALNSGLLRFDQPLRDFTEGLGTSEFMGTISTDQTLRLAIGDAVRGLSIDAAGVDVDGIMRIVREDFETVPASLTVTGRLPEARQRWHRMAEEIISSEMPKSSWPARPGIYEDELFNYFDEVSRKPSARTELINLLSRQTLHVAASSGETMAYRTFLRIQKELGPEAARVFEATVRLNLSGLEHMSRFLNESVVVVNVPFEALRPMHSSGSFYNQFLTQTSRGTLNPLRRVHREFIGMNVPLSANGNARPIYGYLAIPDTNSSLMNAKIEDIFPQAGPRPGSRGWADRFYRPEGSQGPVQGAALQNWAMTNLMILGGLTDVYGDYALVLKPEYRSRASFTVGDSLGGSHTSSGLTDVTTSDLILSNGSHVPNDVYAAFREPPYVESQSMIANTSIYDTVDYVVVRSMEDAEDFLSVFGDDFEVRVIE